MLEVRIAIVLEGLCWDPSTPHRVTHPKMLSIQKNGPKIKKNVECLCPPSKKMISIKKRLKAIRL